MQLRSAAADEVDAFIDLLEDAAQWMRDREIEQWRPESMRAQRPAFVHAQENGELLVAPNSGQIAGGVILTAQPDPIWVDRPEASALYVSKLVVARTRSSEGLGARIIEGVERIARERSVRWLRLDCIASNEPLARYYQRLGYYPRGVVQGLLRHDKQVVREPNVAVGSLDDVDFEHWQPERVATLLFVVRRGQLLLIHKRRGHGVGKINGPGGMVEAGETPLQCALREIEEEVGVQAQQVKPLIELRFQDTDGSSMLGYAFKATGWSGVPRTTDEAIPFWCPIERIPYERMWQDDLVWLRYLLDDLPMIGEFLMHGDRLVAHRLRSSSMPELTDVTSRPFDRR